MAGNIAKRANGKWRARYRDEAGREHSRHFDRKLDAQQWLDGVASAVVTGTYADPRAGRITFAAFFGEWSARQVWAPGTVPAMSLAARSVPFAEKPTKQVRRSDVETWVKQMNAAGLAPGTIKTRYVNVRSVFRAAMKDRVIGTDPTDAVQLPRGRRADVAMSVPTPEDAGQLMALADERFQPFIALCAFAGLRLGETAGVQLADIDFLRRTLKVTRQVQRVTLEGSCLPTWPIQDCERPILNAAAPGVDTDERLRHVWPPTALYEVPTNSQWSRPRTSVPKHRTETSTANVFWLTRLDIRRVKPCVSD